MISLKEQTAIITGGGTGIGQAIAFALAQAEARVVICGRRMEPLEQTVATIETAGGAALAIQADVSVVDDVNRVVSAAVDAFGPVSILINNAGIGGWGYIHEHDIDTWDQVMAVNLRGPFLMARATLPMMRQHRQGHIINISSEVGLADYPGYGAYGVSKHALNALGEFIQGENQEFGIRVNTLCPGMVVAEMTETMKGLDLEKCLPPEDIADLTLWLLTRQANFKVGRPILVQTMVNPWQ